MTVFPHKKIKKPGAMKKKFLLGSTFEIAKNPAGFLSRLSNDYGDVVQVRFAGRKYYVLQHPTLLQHVLLDKYKLYHKPGATKLMRMFLGDGLINSNGDVWLKQRRMMQPAFHSERMNYFADVINEEITDFITRLNKIPDNTKIHINHEFLQLTIRIICRAMFTMQFDEEIGKMLSILEELDAYASAWMKRIVKIPTSWPTKVNKQLNRNCVCFDNLIYKMISERRDEINNGIMKGDLLDMLLNFYDDKTNSLLNKKLLRDQVVTIFMAGHETTAQAISWMFYHLARDKKINEKVKAESEKVCGNNKTVSLEDIPKLCYTRQVIQETLRMYPPVWAIVRKPMLTDKINGFRLPAQSNVLLNIYGLHHHHKYWEQPENFFPDHFSIENEKLRPAFVYAPFGGGPRLCIGQNFAMLIMHIVVSRICRSFEFDVPENYVPVIEPNITLRARHGIQLKINKVNSIQCENLI